MLSANWKWNATEHQYESAKWGYVLEPEELLDLRDTFLDKQRQEMEAHVSRLASGQITVNDWLAQSRETIKQTFVAEYVLGHGGRGSMSPADWGRLGPMCKNQYKYLQGFAEDIQKGMSEEAIKSRANMYIEAARQGYERGASETRGIPRLPQYPGDGQTRCLSNCACHLEYREAVVGWEVTWSLGAAEHCPDCVRLAGEWNPLRIDATGAIELRDAYPGLAGATAPDLSDESARERISARDGGAHKLMDTMSWASAEEIKGFVATDLAAKLKHEWTEEEKAALQSAFPKKKWQTFFDDETANLAANLIQNWAGTSADHNELALSMQEVARGMFKLEEFPYYSPDHMEKAVKILRDNPSAVTALEKFLQTMYDNTQERLREAGIKSVFVWRGMGLDPVEGTRRSDEYAGKVENLKLQPMSSFSADLSTAVTFVRYPKPSVVFVEVPAERIIGTSVSGFGCYDEAEYVVLGGPTSCWMRQAESQHYIPADVSGWLAAFYDTR